MPFLRHATSRHNASEQPTFDVGDSPLLPYGTQQALAMANFLLAHFGLDAIVCSPTERAIQTAVPIAARFQLPIEVHDGLREYNWGGWAGRVIAETFTKDQQTRADVEGIDFRPDDYAETMRETHGRMAKAMADIAGACMGSSLVVGHSFSTKTYMGMQLGLSRREIVDWKIQNCELIGFDPTNPAPPISLHGGINSLIQAG